MCTVMQKDVLIEMIANTMATINVIIEPKAENNEDQNYLIKLKNDLYSTHHDDIDYNLLSMIVKNIKDKYIGQPIHKYYA